MILCRDIAYFTDHLSDVALAVRKSLIARRMVHEESGLEETTRRLSVNAVNDSRANPTYKSQLS